MESSIDRSPLCAGDVKKGLHIIIKNRPCKVVEMSEAKTGKHGHMKVTLTGIDVLTGKKYITNVPGHISLTEFKIDKEDYQLMDVTNDDIQCLNKNMEQVSFAYDKDDEIVKLIKQELKLDKQLLVSVVKAPIMLSTDNFQDEFKIESFKEEKK